MINLEKITKEKCQLCNTYRRDLSLSHFEDEPRVQEKQEVKDQQSYIFVFVACLTISCIN